MSEIFFTSDLHLGHKNILKFCQKTRAQWGNVKDMNDGLRELWCNTVGERDTVYVLGDVGFNPSAHNLALWMDSVPGCKILIKGNHDSKLVRSPEFVKCWDSVHDYLVVRHNKQRYVLFHYPIHSWDGQSRGTYHLHGHTHGKVTVPFPNRVDVGVDGPLGPGPIHIDRVVHYFKSRTY